MLFVLTASLTVGTALITLPSPPAVTELPSASALCGNQPLLIIDQLWGWTSHDACSIGCCLCKRKLHNVWTSGFT